MDVSTPEQAACRRRVAGWRRAVRPVGAIAWWAAVAIALLTTPYDGNSVTPPATVRRAVGRDRGLHRGQRDRRRARRRAVVRERSARERQDVHSAKGVAAQIVHDPSVTSTAAAQQRLRDLARLRRA